MEEEVTLPSASARRERILQVQVDHRRWSSSQDTWWANGRSGSRVQRIECDDRHGPPRLVHDRPVKCRRLGSWWLNFDSCNNAAAPARRPGRRPAGRRGARHCPSAPESPVDCLARAASQRGDSERRSGVSGVDGAVAQRPTCHAPEDRQAGRERSAEELRAGPPRRHDDG